MNSELLMGYADGSKGPDGFVIRVVGHGTMRISHAFKACAESALSSAPLVFDATDCDYLDSTFLGCLIGVQKVADQASTADFIPGRRFVIAADPQKRIRLFSTSALDQYFEFIDLCPPLLGECEPIDTDQIDTMALARHVLNCHERLADRGGHDAVAFQRVVDRLSSELREKAEEETMF